MRRALFSSLAGLSLMCGCRATPGFSWRVEITKPPVLLSPAPVTPVNAPPLAFAVEDVQPFPHVQRSPMTGPGAAARSVVTPADPCNPSSKAIEPLPMPRAASSPTQVRTPASLCSPE